jgi:hypothetical protein
VTFALQGLRNRGLDCEGVFAQRVVTRTFADVKPAMQQCSGRIWNQMWEDPFLWVSEDGEVISLHRKRAIVLKHTMSGEYPAVNVNGRSKHVHRIVCEMWNGPAPFAGAEVRHLDGDKFNNRLANLRWGSRAENYQDKVRHGTDMAGERNPQARLTRAAVQQMRELRETGRTFKSIARQFGIAPMTAHRAITGGSWK